MISAFIAIMNFNKSWSNDKEKLAGYGWLGAVLSHAGS